jgi:hypothetical protein
VCLEEKNHPAEFSVLHLNSSFWSEATWFWSEASDITHITLFISVPL